MDGMCVVAGVCGSAWSAYALRRIEDDTAHFLMVTFWKSEDAVRAFGERHQGGEMYHW